MSATLSTINAIHADAAAKAAATEAAKQREAVMRDGARARCQPLIDDFNSSPIRLVPEAGRVRLTHTSGYSTGVFDNNVTRAAALFKAGARPFLVWQNAHELVLTSNAAAAFANQLVDTPQSALSQDPVIRQAQIRKDNEGRAVVEASDRLLGLKEVQACIEARVRGGLACRHDCVNYPVVGRILDTGRFTTDVHTCDPQRIFDTPADFIGAIVARLAPYLKPVEVPAKKAKGKK